ncbi:MAG: hypothetical protein IT285_15725 [Bdellovibrionales bacterium]|nr:hypothetical protein [Bdellovibrionales bacterium]
MGSIWVKEFFGYCLVLGLGAGVSAPARAGNAAEARQEFCDSAADPAFAQRRLGSGTDHLLAHVNDGGVANSGVCWWHSRLTRAAAYLALYRPELPPPDRAGAKRILARLRAGTQVVEIPGFANLRAFTAQYWDDVQEFLNGWQILDGGLGNGWLIGLQGGTQTSAPLLERGMDRLYASVRQGRVMYQMLQIPGIPAHAWLVVAMSPTATGYRMVVVDSNFGSPQEVNYTHGAESLSWAYGRFVPYTMRSTELSRHESAVRSFCLP